MKLREKEQSLGKSPELRADASLHNVTQEGHWAPDPPHTALPWMDTGPWIPGNSPRVKSWHTFTQCYSGGPLDPGSSSHSVTQVGHWALDPAP